MHIERGQIICRTEHEHAGVPEVLTGIHIGLCRCLIGLLDKAANGTRSSTFTRGSHIAVSGFRMARLNAKRDQAALLRRPLRFQHCCAESGFVLNEVI